MIRAVVRHWVLVNEQASAGVLTTTPTLQPGQSLLMRATAAVPGGAIAGETYGLTLTATSTGGSFGSVLSASNTDTVTVP